MLRFVLAKVAFIIPSAPLLCAPCGASGWNKCVCSAPIVKRLSSPPNLDDEFYTSTHTQEREREKTMHNLVDELGAGFFWLLAAMRTRDDYNKSLLRAISLRP